MATSERTCVHVLCPVCRPVSTTTYHVYSVHKHTHTQPRTGMQCPFMQRVFRVLGFEHPWTLPCPWVLASRGAGQQWSIQRETAIRGCSAWSLMPCRGSTNRCTSSDTASQTNHTGSLLVSLLLCPFRTRGQAAIWDTNATPEDLEGWDSLLKATVLRFPAKRAGQL